MGQPPQNGQELLDRIDRSALTAIIKRQLRLPDDAEVTCHLHRPILGSRGYNGLTTIVSAQYTARDGCCGWTEVLLKWSRFAGKDARWYPLLLAAGAPIPDLLGMLRLDDPPDAGSCDVLVLEYLPHIGYFEQDRGAFAESLGRFHALPSTVLPDLPQLRVRDAVQGWVEVWNRIRVHARGNELGSGISEFVVTHEHEWDRAAAAMPLAAARADTLTRGVIHRDLSTQNTGWRAGRTRLLLFDLPQMAIGPLAQDAQALFPDDRPMDKDVAQTYLAALHGSGGAALSMVELEHEIRAVRPLSPLNFLWWATARSLDGKVDFTDDIEEGRRWYRNTLRQTLERALQSLRGFGSP